MFADRKSVTIETDADGAGTGYIPVPHGRPMSISYVKPASGNYDNGVDFTITVEATGQGLWTESDVNAAKTVYPRVAVHDQAGAGVTFDGTNEIYEPIVMAADRIKIVVAQGGNVKSGTFVAVIG